jgi:hypothetical protein
VWDFLFFHYSGGVFFSVFFAWGGYDRPGEGCAARLIHAGKRLREADLELEGTAAGHPPSL